MKMLIITSRSELRKVLFLAPSVFFLVVYEISRDSHGRRVWSLAQTSSKVKVKVKCQRSRWPRTKTAFVALSAACVRLVFG